MNFAWYDIVGTVGVALIAVTYLLLQIGKLKSEDIRYSLLNGLGASLVIVSLLFEFNLAAFLMEAFWVLISIVGLLRYFAKAAINADKQ